MPRINDGGGKNGDAKVTGNQELTTFAVTETEEESAVDVGDGFNWNSDEISLTAATAMLYLKNNDARTVVITLIAAGVSNGGTHNATLRTLVTVVKNPTTGTLISEANVVGIINQNRNTGSNLTTTNLLVYNAASSSKTVTDGDSAFLFYMGADVTNRLAAGISFEIETGGSVAIVIDPDLSGGATLAYAALVGHFKSATR